MNNESMVKSINNKKRLIVAICMLIQAIPFGVAQNIQPLFIPYVVNAFGFSLAGFSLIFTFGAIASAACSPFLGKLYGKINIKLLFIVGITLSALGFLSFGFAKSLPTFYILSAISQVGTIIFSGLGIPYIINNWYPGKGRGKALGIAFAGGAIGNVFLQQIVSMLLESKGASVTYIIFGIVALVVGIPLSLFFIKLPKQDEAENITASTSTKNTPQNQATPIAFEGLGAKATRKNIYFWTFSIGYAIIAIAISALSTQYATYFNGYLGMSARLVGTLGSIFALFCLIGNVSGGVLFDKMGTFKTMFLAMILMIISICALLFSTQIHYVAFLFSIAYGLNVYSYMAAPAFMATDVFGKKDASEILGTISLIFALGFAFGSTIFGVIVDRFGFITGWISMLVCVLVGYGLLLISIKKVKTQNKELTS